MSKIIKKNNVLIIMCKCVVCCMLYVVVFFLVGHRASTRAATLHLFDQNYTKCHP